MRKNAFAEYEEYKIHKILIKDIQLKPYYGLTAGSVLRAYFADEIREEYSIVDADANHPPKNIISDTLKKGGFLNGK